MIYTGDKFPMWKGNFFVGGMVGAAGRAAHPRCEARLHQPRAAGAPTLAASATSGRASTGYIYLVTDDRDGKPTPVLRMEPVERQTSK